MTPNESVKSINSSSKGSFNKALPSTYRATDCIKTFPDGHEESGGICYWSANARDCKKATSCTSGDNTHAAMAPYFTPNELDAWGNGDVMPTATSASDIYDRYELYLHFHLLDDNFYHPNSIIILNEW